MLGSHTVWLQRTSMTGQHAAGGLSLPPHSLPSYVAKFTLKHARQFTPVVVDCRWSPKQTPCEAVRNPSSRNALQWLLTLFASCPGAHIMYRAVEN